MPLAEVAPWQEFYKPQVPFTGRPTKAAPRVKVRCLKLIGIRRPRLFTGFVFRRTAWTDRVQRRLWSKPLTEAFTEQRVAAETLVACPHRATAVELYSRLRRAGGL